MRNNDLVSGKVKRLAIAALAAALSTGFPAERAAAQQAPAVIVAEAQMQDLRRVSTFTGRVASLQKVDVRARVSGFLEERPFTEGGTVARGDLLFRIEEDSYRDAVVQIEAQIASANAQLRLAGIEKERKTTLVAREAVAQSELDIATANYDIVAADIARLEAAKADAELQLSYTRVTAPFDGVAGLSAPDIGALVGPESGALTTLTSLDPISVEFPVATAIYLDYEKQAKESGRDTGEDVTITLPNGETYPNKGRLDYVSSTVSAGTDTVLVRALFDNPDRVLLDGALVNVDLSQSAPELALGVPMTALLRDQQGAYVLVVGADSKVEQRRVSIERSAGGFAVIANGLSEGEMVITQGQNKVRPGITVDAALASEG
ncbi:MAG: efflux RND transporter periplasmic adaptor subunit [Pikeienuella sp.]